MIEERRNTKGMVFYACRREYFSYWYLIRVSIFSGESHICNIIKCFDISTISVFIMSQISMISLRLFLLYLTFNNIMQICDSPEKIDTLIKMLQSISIVEVARTGTLALSLRLFLLYLTFNNISSRV